MSTQCDCSLIIPTLNRRDILRETLSRIILLPDHHYEIIVVDNGSTDETVKTLTPLFPRVRWIQLKENSGSAARNVAAEVAKGRVLLMLDDDSWPTPGVINGVVSLFDRRLDLGAVACRVRLADPPQAHDAGGVPGVFFNCGGAIRRKAFIEAGGFPADYDYYVEEYALSCALWQKGWRVEPRGEFLIWHRRSLKNRDNNRMLRLLVRNNFRLWHQYAPDELLDDLLDSTTERYRRVAMKENALAGFEAGLAEARAEIAAQKKHRNPVFQKQFESLFGLDRARAALLQWADNHGVKNAAVWTRGKGCEQLIETLSSVRIRAEGVYDYAVEDRTWRGIPLYDIKTFRPDKVDGVIIGSLSPGTAEDMRAMLSAQFGDIPVASPAPWESPAPVSLTANT